MKKIEVGQTSKIEGLYRKVIEIKNNWALLENYIGESQIISSYDVIKINILNKDRNILGKITEKGTEFLSRSKQWGTNGFTFKEKNTAINFLNTVKSKDE